MARRRSLTTQLSDGQVMLWMSAQAPFCNDCEPVNGRSNKGHSACQCLQQNERCLKFRLTVALKVVYVEETEVTL